MNESSHGCREDDVLRSWSLHFNYYKILMSFPVYIHQLAIITHASACSLKNVSLFGWHRSSRSTCLSYRETADSVGIDGQTPSADTVVIPNVSLMKRVTQKAKQLNPEVKLRSRLYYFSFDLTNSLFCILRH